MLPLIREGKGAKVEEPAGPPQPCVSEGFLFAARSLGLYGRCVLASSGPRPRARPRSS